MHNPNLLSHKPKLPPTRRARPPDDVPGGRRASWPSRSTAA